jgi:uncharacterized protein (DUF1501 family)
MHVVDTNRHTRRAFLRRTGQLALAGTAAPLAVNLATIGELAAQTASDYKALVCVFLYGGNDHMNTVVPYDEARHATYARVRGPLAIARAAMAATELNPTTPLADGSRFALAPEMAELAALFNSGRMAVQLNVGPLVVPLTRAQYFDRSSPQPPKLFSHNDQQSVWQSKEAEGSTRGWGGGIGDTVLAANGQSLFTCISVAGNAVFLAGQNALQYQCSTAGAVAVEALRGSPWGHFLFEASQRPLFEQLLRQSHPHPLTNEYNRVVARSLDAEQRVTSALNPVQLRTVFPAGNELGSQLKVVARLIGARSALGVKRQVFMVSLGGFDVHDGMASRQPVLLRKVSQAMGAFDAALTELGVQNQVTTFTASDFGRAFTINGDGTDHGWGGHHFIMGGAVKGKAFYGTPPPLSTTQSSAPEDQWHVGQGRLLPSTSVDQYAATMAKWFGLSTEQQLAVLPNLRNFGAGANVAGYPIDVGFMA